MSTGQKTDDAAIQNIATELQEKPDLIKELIAAGIRNTQFIDFYRQYADEDSEESREEIAADGTSDAEKLFFKMELAEKVMEAFESLNYRERANGIRTSWLLYGMLRHPLL